MQLCKLLKCYFNHFLISLSISDLEILAKRVSVLYAVVHGRSSKWLLRHKVYEPSIYVSGEYEMCVSHGEESISYML